MGLLEKSDEFPNGKVEEVTAQDSETGLQFFKPVSIPSTKSPEESEASESERVVPEAKAATKPVKRRNPKKG